MVHNPMTGPNTAKAFRWSASPNSSRISPKPWGSIAAAVTPWSTRATISAHIEGASAHSAEVATSAGGRSAHGRARSTCAATWRSRSSRP
jgi:hypothetical protein